jgi:antitoxin YefM
VSILTSYSNARENFASLLERVTADREIVVINRRGHEDVAMVSMSELNSLLETAHLLRSPKNAQRLLQALNNAQTGQQQAKTLNQLRQDVGLDEKE